MRGIALRGLCVSALVASGLAVPLAGTASAKDVKKPISANAPALKVTFGALGDNGALTFSGIKNQTVKVKTSAGTYAANCDVMVTILKNTTVVAGPVCGGIAGTTGNVSLPANATYTIKLDTQGHAPASLEVALTSTGPKKSITPNAAAVTYAVPASATTDFGFIVKAGQRLSALTAAGTLGACQLQIQIVAPDKTTVLGYATCAGESVFVDALDGVGPGAYTLRVINTAAPTGTVKLQVFQFTDTSAGPITANGAAATGKVAWPGQRTSFTFSGTNGQKISYEVTASTLSGYVELYAPDGSYSGNYAGAAAGQLADSFTLDATGTWTIVVDGSGASKGSVTVRLYTFSDVSGGTITAGGGPKSLTITTPGQNGAFTFSGTDGQKISFKVAASTLQGYVELHKPDGSYAGTFTGAAEGQFADAFVLDTTGTWSLVVDPSGTSTGSVTLRLYTFTDVAGPTIVANGAAKSLTITTPGQNGAFTFAGTNGQQISFAVTASTISGYVELHKPDGSYGGTYTGAVAGQFADSFTLDTTGTWSLVVDPGGASTGSVTVKLYTFSDVAGPALAPGGAAKSLTIATPGQNGRFTFAGSNGDTRAFEVTTSTLSGYVELHRPDGSYAGAFTCLGAGCASGPFNLDATGTWTLLVDPSGTSTGTVKIKLT